MDRIFQDLTTGGQSGHGSETECPYFARTHFVSRFRAEHPEWNHDGPSRVSTVTPEARLDSPPPGPFYASFREIAHRRWFSSRIVLFLSQHRSFA